MYLKSIKKMPVYAGRQAWTRRESLMSPLMTLSTVSMSFRITSPVDFSSPTLTKDKSLSDISMWRTEAGYFGNWCWLQMKPGRYGWASSNQQKPFQKHEWELEHALFAYCFKDGVCAVLTKGMLMRLWISLFQPSWAQQAWSISVEKNISTNFKSLWIFRKTTEETNTKLPCS